MDRILWQYCAQVQMVIFFFPSGIIISFLLQAPLGSPELSGSPNMYLIRMNFELSLSCHLIQKYEGNEKKRSVIFFFFFTILAPCCRVKLGKREGRNSFKNNLQ